MGSPNVCELACKTYVRALCPENIQSGFKRTGICPLNPNAVPLEYLLPAEIYTCTTEHDSQDTVAGGIPVDTSNSPSLILKAKENKLKTVKSENSKKPRQTMGKLVAGKELDKQTVELMIEHESKQKKKTEKTSVTEKKKYVKSSGKQPKTSCKQTNPISESQPGPSHLRLDIDTDSSDDVTDEEVCCVYM